MSGAGPESPRALVGYPAAGVETCGREAVPLCQGERVEPYRFRTCAFGHHAVEPFFFWGFMRQAVRWGERSGHEPKPVFLRVRDLIHNERSTREQLTTDSQG